MHIHEIEEQQHGRDGINVYGVLCATHEEACRVAGCDTPADLAEEMAWREEQDQQRGLDAMEARGGPIYDFTDGSDDIPF